MKVCIITAVWKRPEIFEIFAQAVKNLEGDIVVCVAGSEGNRSRKMVEAHGFQYIEAKNDPLSLKWNKVSNLASQTGADYYLLMGSDDIINQPLYDKYIEVASKGWEYAYLTDGYFYDTVSKKSIYWSGYNKNRAGSKLRRSLGCGRLVSKRLMERVRWNPWLANKYDAMLDTGFDEKMNLEESYSIGIRVEGTDMRILDIKSSTNMTPFEMWDNTEEVSKNEIFDYFPENITKLL